MRRPWVFLIAGVVAAAVVVVVVVTNDEPADEAPAAALPPPVDCEPEARDLNPDDAAVAPSRGVALIPPLRGHVPVGFNDPAYQSGQLDLGQALALYEATDTTIWRLPLDWGGVEQAPGTFDFRRYDDIYCAAVAAGVRPLWHLTGVPTWAVPPGSCAQLPCVRPPEDEHLPQLERFAEAAAIRYPRSAAFEAWNEPNLSAFWGGPPDPAVYLRVLEAIWTGTKNGNPDMPVLGGALSNNPVDTTETLSLQTFLATMLLGGAAEHMDGLAIHAYPVAPLGEPGDEFTPALEVSRSALAAEDGGIRIWVTELGAPTERAALPQVTPEQQADILSEAYRALDGADDVDAALFHTLVDPPPSVPGGPGFGFFEKPAGGSVRAKPVVCRVLRATGSNASCPIVVEL